MALIVSEAPRYFKSLRRSRVIAQELQALRLARAPKPEVMSSGSEKKYVVDVVRGELIVQIRRGCVEVKAVFSAAIEIDRKLARPELGEQRHRIVGVPVRAIVGTEHPANPRAERLGIGAPRSK